MLKQFKDMVKDVVYVHLPITSDGRDYIMTMDGVFIEYNLFKKMTVDDYNNLKVKKSQYDYQKTRIEGKPILLSDTMEKKVIREKVNNSIEEKKPRKAGKYHKRRLKLNPIRWVMLLVSIFCSILSIYYTREYLSRTNPMFFATILSVSMLLYSLVGYSLAPSCWKKKKYIISILLMTTSILGTCFSMFTSLDTNLTRYMKEQNISFESKKEVNTNRLVLDTLNEQILENRKQYKDVSSQLEYYETLGMGTSIIRTQMGQISKEYKELQDKKIKILTDTPDSVLTESTRDMTLTDLIGQATNTNGNILQMIIMLFASVFIDILAPIALYIFLNNFTVKKENS